MANTPVVQTTAVTLTDQADPLAKQIRRQLTQSGAYRLVTSNEEDEVKLGKAVEIITPLLREAFAGWEAEAAPLGDYPLRDRALFIAQDLGKFIKLVGGGWHPEQRKEWLDAACEELESAPRGLLVQTVAEARKAVWDAKRFVPWCFERMEKRLNLLNEEGRVLRKLVEIAAK